MSLCTGSWCHRNGNRQQQTWVPSVPYTLLRMRIYGTLSVSGWSVSQSVRAWTARIFRYDMRLSISPFTLGSLALDVSLCLLLAGPARPPANMRCGAVIKGSGTALGAPDLCVHTSPMSAPWKRMASCATPSPPRKSRSPAPSSASPHPRTRRDLSQNQDAGARMPPWFFRTRCHPAGSRVAAPTRVS